MRNSSYKLTAPTAHAITNPAHNLVLQIPRENQDIIGHISKNMILMENRNANTGDVFSLFVRCRIDRIRQKILTDAAIVQQNSGFSWGAIASYRFTNTFVAEDKNPTRSRLISNDIGAKIQHKYFLYQIQTILLPLKFHSHCRQDRANRQNE